MEAPRVQVTQRLIDSQLPPDFDRRVVDAIVGAYAETQQRCSEEFGPEGHDLRGHMLRALVDRKLRLSLSTLPGVATDFAKTSIGNCHYLRIRVGRLIITASAVETRSSLVRHADFRLTLAQSSQLELFEFPDGPDDAARSLYLLILHGPCGARQDPAFIDLVPPTRDCLGYVEEARVRMLDRVASATVPTPIKPEVITPTAPELLPSAAKEEGRA